MIDQSHEYWNTEQDKQQGFNEFAYVQQSLLESEVDMKIKIPHEIYLGVGRNSCGILDTSEQAWLRQLGLGKTT